MGPVHAMRQSCRPKHQVLILKCYPGFQKNAVDVKPNSSELSYLLYYASTRRSKVQKVGAFLEKKTARDVLRGKIGDVQVTLQILRALIEKSPRDIPLYATYILHILDTVLRSKDLNMVEESIPAFQACCRNQDVAKLGADQGLVFEYEKIVRLYAGFAIQSLSPQAKGLSSAPIAIRWRNVGLQAIKAISSSEYLGADGGRQLNIIVPMILANLHPEDKDHLIILQQRIEATEKTDQELLLRRKLSITTTRTADRSSEAHSAAVSATTADADRLAEEEVGVLALQCLKQIFVSSNRGQIRMATTSMLEVFSKDAQPANDRKFRSGAGTWATMIMEMVTRWAPVQDRFIVLVTTMETLVRSPMNEQNLEQQLALAMLVGWLLSSNINMIGLSVMDVLLGLIQHILILLQLGGKGTSVLPHHQQMDAIDIFQDSKGAAAQQSSTEGLETAAMGVDVASPSTIRQELLTRLRRCIGDLATHVYYSDQISDMITAILLRLKPSPVSGIHSAAAAIEDPAATAQAISNSVNLKEDPNTDDFFSFGTARITALKAIQNILTIANTKSAVAGITAIGRNRVSVRVWEGTQWLLRDEDRRVRRAYVDALLTWLKLEMSKNDLRVMEDKRKTIRNTFKANGDVALNSNMPKRVVSSVSRSDKKPATSTFLPLLHLAIYDNAIETPESEPDIMLLHLLLFHLVEKLGVNGVKNGLPMMIRLQEDINNDALMTTPSAKINVGSLVHGYLWTLSEMFDFDATRVGYEIYTEILRRKEHNLWLDGVQFPALPIEQIIAATAARLTEKPPLSAIRHEALKPFDGRSALVDQIAIAYSNSISSPPTSPPSSPGRAFSQPILTSQGSKLSSEDELPTKIREAMLLDWTKQSCIATVEKESTRTVSLNGSRIGTNVSARHLTVNGHSHANGSPTGMASPVCPPGLDLASQQDRTESQSPTGARQGFTALQSQYRRPSAQDNDSPTPISSSDNTPTLRVEDLKRALSRGYNTKISRGASPLRQSIVEHYSAKGASPSASGESLISANGVTVSSESGAMPQIAELRRPQSSSSADKAKFIPGIEGEDAAVNAKALKGEIVPPRSRGGEGDEDVPPVPPLPPSISKHPNSALAFDGSSSRPDTRSSAIGRSRNASQSESRHSMRRKSADLARERRVSGKLFDIGALLGGIEVGNGRAVGKPPY